jgi:hypothetical protein
MNRLNVLILTVRICANMARKFEAHGVGIVYNQRAIRGSQRRMVRNLARNSKPYEIVGGFPLRMVRNSEPHGS